MYLKILNEGLLFNSSPTKKELNELSFLIFNPKYKIIDIDKVNNTNNSKKLIKYLISISSHRFLYSKYDYIKLLELIANNGQSKQNALLLKKALSNNVDSYIHELFEKIYATAKTYKITFLDAAYINGLNLSYIGNNDEYELLIKYLKNYIKTCYNLKLTDNPDNVLNSLIDINRRRFNSKREYSYYFDKEGFKRPNIMIDQIKNTFMSLK